MRIDAMLNSMTPVMRDVFLGAQLDGLKDSELAARHGIAVSTVHKYMMKALQGCMAVLVNEA